MSVAALLLKKKGGAIGYLTGGSNRSSTNSLDAPKPVQQTGIAADGLVEAVVEKLSPFFFKQKTAYELSLRDWSSDVCSSDLLDLIGLPPTPEEVASFLDDDDL